MFTALSEDPICGITEGLRRAAFRCYGVQGMPCCSTPSSGMIVKLSTQQ